jgi:hypothetical protein
MGDLMGYGGAAHATSEEEPEAIGDKPTGPMKTWLIRGELKVPAAQTTISLRIFHPERPVQLRLFKGLLGSGGGGSADWGVYWRKNLAGGVTLVHEVILGLHQNCTAGDVMQIPGAGESTVLRTADTNTFNAGTKIPRTSPNLTDYLIHAAGLAAAQVMEVVILVECEEEPELEYIISDTKLSVIRYV